MKLRLTEEQRSKILDLLHQGHDRHAIAALVGVTAGQVSAVSAHLRMGTYAHVAQHSKDSKILQMPTKTIENQEATNGIPVGVDANGNMAFWVYEGHDGLQNPHLLVCGESGSGKTYAISCLLGELKKRSKSSIVFDYAQGFISHKSIPGFHNIVNPRVLNLSLKGIAINPLDILAMDLHGPVSVSQRVADTFTRVYPRIGVQQHAVLRDAILELFHDAGIQLSDRRSWRKPGPSFAKIIDKLNDIASRRSSLKKVADTLSAHISSLFVFDLFRSDGENIGWEHIINNQSNCYILSLHGLDDLTSKIVSEFLLWSLIGFAESSGPSSVRAFIVLDEAHRLPFSAGSPVERILREGRKFGLAAILSSQQPEDFSPVAFANTAAKIVFQTTDEASVVSRRLFRKAGSGPSFSEIYEILPRLSRGCAFAVFGNKGVLVRILTHEERSTRRTKRT